MGPIGFFSFGPNGAELSRTIDLEGVYVYIILKATADIA